mmetsp:Transcript_141663/g.440423  ORF Transcript_141663/g.440423 Transcript_141663/m.440423 type:complete len:88 (+) Transcript_141663:83-346(+)
MRLWSAAAVFALIASLCAASCTDRQCTAEPTSVAGASILTRKAERKPKRAVTLEEDEEERNCQTWCSTVPSSSWSTSYTNECGGCSV